MKISSKRLLTLLKDQGFWLAWESKPYFVMEFNRKSHVDDLFDTLKIVGQGKSGEAVGVLALLSAFRTRSRAKLLMKDKYLQDIGNNMPTYSQDRKWTIIENNDDAVVWEKELASKGPVLSTAFATAEGPTFSARTEQIRDACRKYLNLMQPLTTVLDLQSRLNGHASAIVQREVERVLDSSCVISLTEREGKELYPIAVLALLLFGEQVETRKSPFWGKVPLDEPEYMARIQLLVDLLARPEQGLL